MNLRNDETPRDVEIAALKPLDEHNETLRTNTHPPDWQNPKPAGRYNLVVIGAGTAGLVTAAGAAGLGAKVALVERGLMGGDCLNVGCVPSKGVISAARAAASIKDAKKFGVQVQDAQIDFAAVMERMRRLRAGISHHDSAQRFTDLGVDVFLGEASFSGHDNVEVAGQTLRFRRAVIATGARAAELPIPGFQAAGVLTNETVFSLTDLPRRMAVIGAGPIGCEMAQAFARLGSKVTLVERSDRILHRDDREAAQIVQESLERDGVDIRLRTDIVRIAAEDAGKIVHVKPADSDEESLQVDEILIGVGRQPNVEGLNLEQAGVEYDQREGVKVDDHLQATNSRIYAAGDICSKLKFTHAADFMARIVIQNALFMGRRKISALIVPWCTYTSPELAQIGLTENEAAQQNIEIDTFSQPLAEVDRAILDGETEGFVKILVKKGSDKILGATIVAEHAGDMIGALSIAMTNGIGLGKIANSIHPYPTQAEAIRKVGDLYNRTRLTPKVKWAFDKWLKWRR